MCFALSGRNDSTLTTSCMETNKYNISTEETTSNYQKVLTEKPTEFPFDVYIDKPSLELKKTKETRVFIDTELTDWNYSVQAKHGTISEKNSNSFVYTRPKDENHKNDVVTIELVDGENKIQYKYVIPLNYIFNPENIVNRDSEIRRGGLSSSPDFGSTCSAYQ